LIAFDPTDLKEESDIILKYYNPTKLDCEAMIVNTYKNMFRPYFIRYEALTNNT